MPPPSSPLSGHLRVSLTDACGLRCTHCRPESAPFRLRSRLLHDEELLHLLRLCAEVGFRHIHFAGGEPTLRSSIVEIVRETARIPGITRVSLATDGHQFSTLARPLKAAGLHAVQFSLGNLAPDGFGRPVLSPVAGALAPARLAVRAGLETTVNVRLARAPRHRADLAALAKLTLAHDVRVRFIAEPAVRADRRKESAPPLGRAEILDLLHRQFGAPAPAAPASDGPPFRLPGARGTLACIDATGGPSCDSCNLLRLSAEGDLRLCAVPGAEAHLRMMLHHGADDDTLREAIRRAVHLMPPLPVRAPGARCA